MTLVNVDTHVGPDPKTHVSEMGNFMGRSTPSPAACVAVMFHTTLWLKAFKFSLRVRQRV